MAKQEMVTFSPEAIALDVWQGKRDEAIARYGIVGGYLAEKVPVADDAMERILGAIMLANTTDEVFDSVGELQKAEVFFGRDLVVTDVQWTWSDFLEGSPVYAIVSARVDQRDKDTGTFVTTAVKFSCGAAQACVQLARFQDGGAFPLALRFVQASKPTSAGFYPVWVGRPESF